MSLGKSKTILHVAIPKSWLPLIEQDMRIKHYTTKSEYLRSLLRERLNELENNASARPFIPS